MYIPGFPVFMKTEVILKILSFCLQKAGAVFMGSTAPQDLRRKISFCLQKAGAVFMGSTAPQDFSCNRSIVPFKSIMWDIHLSCKRRVTS